jgi:hypothetical protein
MQKIIFFLFICSVSTAQNVVSFGAKAGLNLSDVIGDGFKKMEKRGFNGGFILQLKLAKSYSCRVNAQFSSKGTSYNWYSDDIYVPRYFIRLYYLDFPILFCYHKKAITYEIGPGIGYLLDERESVSNQNLFVTSNHFKKQDVTMNIGIGYKIYGNFSIDLLYSVSVVPIRNQPRNQYNSLFTLTVNYIFPIHNKKQQD